MMSLRKMWLILGLLMVIAGATAATNGYLAVRDAKARAAMTIAVTTPAVKAQPTTKKTSAITIKRRSKSGRTTRRGDVAVASRKVPATAPTTRSSSSSSSNRAITTANPNAPDAAAGKWRAMMWWGGGVLLLGLISVGYSLHEMLPKAPPTGADEMLNDAPPF